MSAESPKTNTTRAARLGVVHTGERQVTLYDTPGIVGPASTRGAAHGRRVRSAWAHAASCDALLFVVDARRQARGIDTPPLFRIWRLHPYLVYIRTITTTGLIVVGSPSPR